MCGLNLKWKYVVAVKKYAMTKRRSKMLDKIREFKEKMARILLSLIYQWRKYRYNRKNH